MKKLIWLGGLSYFVIGLATVIFGTLLSELLHDYDRNFSNGGHLVFTQFAGFLAVISSLFLEKNYGVGPFAIVALCAIIMAIFWGSTPISMETVEHTGKITAANVPKLPGKKRIKLYPLAFLMVFVFLYVGLETSVINFLPSILAHRLQLFAAWFCRIQKCMDRLYSCVHSRTFSFRYFCNIDRIHQLHESRNDKANNKLHHRFGWHWRSRTALAGRVEHGRHSTGRCDMAFDWFHHSHDAATT